MKPWVWWFLAICILIAVLAVAFGNNNTGNTGSAGGGGGSSSSPAAQLASYSGESESAIQGGLDSLSFECTESESKLANEVANSLDDLANNGRTQSAVGFMNATRRAAQPIAPTRCAQVMAALLVLMEK